MDYTKAYNRIIERAQSENRQKGGDVYYERHRILPKCLGGGNKIVNLVLLTGREHFICHKLLVEIYPENKSLFHAVWMMCSCKIEERKRSYSASSREYERYKKLNISINREKFKGENNPMFGSHRVGKLNPNYGNKISEETRKKQSDKRKEYLKTHTPPGLGKKGELSPNFGKRGEQAPYYGKVHSAESRAKISTALKGKYLGPATSQYGKKKSKEAKEKQRETWNNKPQITCPYCGIVGTSVSNLTRFHFDNCKLKDLINKT